MTCSDQFDVAVLGLGPVGSLAVILLAHAGLRVAAVEKDPSVYKLPRAVNLDGEIVRALQGVGLAEAIDALLQSVRPGEKVGFANSKREVLFGQEPKAFGVNGWQPSNMFDQPQVEQFLRDHALASDNVTGFIGSTATSLHQTNELVTLHCTSGDSTANITARYLIACDGASSFARKSLGIEWLDLGYDHDWLVVDVIAKDGHTLTNTTLQVCDPARLTTYVCTKDPYRRWEFKLNDGESWEEMLEPRKIASLIDPWTPRGTYEVRRAAVYQFHAAHAAQWRVGRVLLAGDAAHQMPPFLGQGMNTGMRDVINLSWKLPLVLAGVGGQALLDSYQAERGAHAHELVDWAVAVGQLMQHLADVEYAENHAMPVPQEDPELRTSGYGQGREQPPLRGGIVMSDQVGQGGGGLFSQPIVANPDGHRQHLDDYLGKGFALVTRSGDVELDEAATTTAERLGVRCVSLQDLEPVRGHFDRVFEHANAVLVRPDRYIFGFTTDARSAAELLGHLESQIGAAACA